MITYFVAILVDFDILTLAFHAFFLADLKQLLQPLLRFFEPVAGVSFEEKSSLFSRGVKRGVRIDVEVLIFVDDFLAEESYFDSHVAAEPLRKQFANGLFTLFLHREVGQKVEESSLDENGNGLEVEGRILRRDFGSHCLQWFDDIRF